MTLPELLSAAIKHLSGELILSANERFLLVLLLEGYADDVLEAGHTLKFDGVEIARLQCDEIEIRLASVECPYQELTEEKEKGTGG